MWDDGFGVDKGSLRSLEMADYLLITITTRLLVIHGDFEAPLSILRAL
jgi:hypothetical protein